MLTCPICVSKDTLNKRQLIQHHFALRGVPVLADRAYCPPKPLLPFTVQSCSWEVATQPGTAIKELVKAKGLQLMLTQLKEVFLLQNEAHQGLCE